MGCGIWPRSVVAHPAPSGSRRRSHFARPAGPTPRSRKYLTFRRTANAPVTYTLQYPATVLHWLLPR